MVGISNYCQVLVGNADSVLYLIIIMELIFYFCCVVGYWGSGVPSSSEEPLQINEETGAVVLSAGLWVMCYTA